MWRRIHFAPGETLSEPAAHGPKAGLPHNRGLGQRTIEAIHTRQGSHQIVPSGTPRPSSQSRSGSHPQVVGLPSDHPGDVSQAGR